MTSDQKRDLWTKRIDGWRQSQLSQRAYCQEHKLSYAQFNYWRTRLNRQSSSKGNLIPVKVPTAGGGSVIISISSGVRLEAPLASLQEVLPIILHAVQDAH